jgi:hypothetical protein
VRDHRSARQQLDPVARFFEGLADGGLCGGLTRFDRATWNEQSRGVCHWIAQ